RRLREAGREGRVARVEGVEHGAQVVRGDVGDRADVAGAADRVEGQVVLLAARVVGEAGAGDDLLGGEEVVRAVLDRDDPGVSGEPQQGVRLDPGARAGRDVVEGHREARAVGDLPEVGLDGVLRGTAVVGGDQQQAVGARLLRPTGQSGGVRGVGRADARDDPGTV